MELETTDVIEFFVNGESVQLVNPSSELTLLTFLREQLGLKGTKLSCGEGACGACTVTLSSLLASGVVRHTAINACMTPICSLHGMAITTTEGLGGTAHHGNGKSIHPVQERLYKGHGSQCGFCSPGMVMSMSSLLRDTWSCRKQRPTELQVTKALEGNLCRCTGYRPILEAFFTFCNPKQNSNATNDINNGDLKAYVDEIDDPVLPALSALRNKACLKLDGGKWYTPKSMDQLEKLILAFAPNLIFHAGGQGRYKVPVALWKSDKPTVIIQTTLVPKLHTLNVTDDGNLEVGSCVTMTNLLAFLEDLRMEKSRPKSILEVLLGALERVGSAQVRNIATLAGHLQWAHPCSDLIPLLMALKAKIQVLRCNSNKLDPLEMELNADFFQTPYRTCLKQGDLITSIIIPIEKEGIECFYYRRARRKAFDLPVANAAFVTKINGPKIDELFIVAGGSEGAALVPDLINASMAKMLFNTMKYLKDNGVEEVNHKVITELVLQDLNLDQGSSYHARLIVSFVIRFLQEVQNEGEQGDFDLRLRSTVRSTQAVVRDEAKKSLGAVEKPIAHLASAQQTTGEAVFIDDIRHVEKELCLVPVTSKRAKAFINAIDFSEAVKMEGIVGYVSADDIADHTKQMMMGRMGPEVPVFASKEVTHHGQILAGLLCENKEQGMKAREKVSVDYGHDHVDGIVLTLDDITNKECKPFMEPLIFQRNQRSDMPSPSSEVSVSGTVRMGAQEHMYMEPQSCLVVPMSEKDEYLVEVACQDLAEAQRDLSNILGVPCHKINVRCKRMGGSFGGKENWHTAAMTAVAAKKFGRPVRLIMNRQDDFAFSGKKHNSQMSYKASLDMDTLKLTHLKFDAQAIAGSVIDCSFLFNLFLLVGLEGGYTLTDFYGKAAIYRTNQVNNCAFRGFGRPEGQFYIENVIERLAHEAKVDPHKIREANLTNNGDLLHYGDTRVKGCTLRALWEACLKQSNFQERKKKIETWNASQGTVKKGLAMIAVKLCPAILHKPLMKGHAYVRIFTDGSVLISHGGIEVGQGINTKMVQIASKELGDLDTSRIHIRHTETDGVANATITAASCGTDLNGLAVMDACKKLWGRLEPYRKKAPEDNLGAWAKEADIDHVNLAATGFGGYETITGIPTPREVKDDGEVKGETITDIVGSGFHYFTYGVGCVEVEVNCLTGDFCVGKVDIVMDVGQSINPAIDLGQVEGAFVKGIGVLTTEQIMVNPTSGEMLTKGPSTYCLPTVADIPREMHVSFWHPEGTLEATSPVYSSKGVGEPPQATAVATVCAIREAIKSYRMQHGNEEWFDLNAPLTGKKIRDACKDQIIEDTEAIQDQLNNVAVEY